MNIVKILVRGFVDFYRGILKMPIHWQLWMALLVAGNMVVPLFFLERLESLVVLAALVGSFLLMVVLTGFAGFTRLLGLGHIVFWVPLVVYIFTRFSDVPPDDFFGIWLRVLLAINLLSLVIDAADVIRYVAGDRSDTLSGSSNVESPQGESI